MKKRLRDCNLTKVGSFVIYRISFLIAFYFTTISCGDLITFELSSSSLGVKGILILNADGQPIRSNLPVEDTDNYAALVSQVIIVNV